MTSIYDVNQQELVEKTAQKLKSVDSITPPEWSAFVKTGMSRERPPTKDDWWYSRSASILLKLNKLSPVGVSKLRRYYGSKKNRGTAPEKFFRGSGSIIRKVLQQLEKAGFAKQVEIGVHKGRAITKQGKIFLNTAATGIKPVKKVQISKADSASKPETPKPEQKQSSETAIVDKPKPKEAPNQDKPSEIKKEPKAEPKKQDKPKVKEESPKKEEKKK